MPQRPDQLQAGSRIEPAGGGDRIHVGVEVQIGGEDFGLLRAQADELVERRQPRLLRRVGQLPAGEVQRPTGEVFGIAPRNFPIERDRDPDQRAAQSPVGAGLWW